MPRLGTLFLEQARILDGDARFAGKDAHEFKMPFVKDAFILGKNSHRADSVIVGDKRNAAEAASFAKRLDAEFFDFGGVIFADQDRLARTNDVFRDVVSGRTAARRFEHAANHFDIELHFVANRIERADVKVLDVKQAPKLLPDFALEGILIESGAESAANLV